MPPARYQAPPQAGQGCPALRPSLAGGHFLAAISLWRSRLPCRTAPGHQALRADDGRYVPLKAGAPAQPLSKSSVVLPATNRRGGSIEVVKHVSCMCHGTGWDHVGMGQRWTEQKRDKPRTNRMRCSEYIALRPKASPSHSTLSELHCTKVAGDVPGDVHGNCPSGMQLQVGR